MWFYMNWKSYAQNIVLRKEFLITIIFLAIILFFFPKFLQLIEARKGVILPDPILGLFNPIDLSWMTFGLIYLSLIAALIYLVKDPNKLVLALQCYGLMVIFRMIAMYITPLEAPASLIPLNDPFVQFFGTGQILEKDLFFSGHTATLFLLFLVSENRILKAIFIISTVLVGLAVLLQHVHYSIDVFAALFFAYTSYRIISLTRNKLIFRRVKTNE